jgi:hypothetical protein
LRGVSGTEVLSVRSRLVMVGRKGGKGKKNEKKKNEQCVRNGCLSFRFLFF